MGRRSCYLCLLFLTTTTFLTWGYGFTPVSDSFLSPVVMEDEKTDQKDFPMLSSFELFSIADLLMEITVRPCSFVSRPIMESIKKFLVSGLLHAPQLPQESDSHSQFYSTYHTLVNCLSRTDETYSKAKSIDSPFITDANKESISKAWRTFSSVLRRRRAAEENDQDQPSSVNNHLKDELLDELSIIDENLSFEEFFALLLSITNDTCHLELGVWLPADFLVSLFSEVTYWAKAQGSSVYKTAQVKYFHNSNVLDELRKCHRILKSTSLEKTSTTPPKYYANPT